MTEKGIEVYTGEESTEEEFNNFSLLITLLEEIKHLVLIAVVHNNANDLRVLINNYNEHVNHNYSNHVDYDFTPVLEVYYYLENGSSYAEYAELLGHDEIAEILNP